MPTPDPAAQPLAERSPDAAGLLCLCAFLDPARPVPVCLFDHGVDALPPHLAGFLRDPAARERAFDALLDAGVGGVAGTELVLRAPAAVAAREGMQAEARATWAAAALALVERAFPEDPAHADHRRAAEALLPHAVAAATHAAGAGVSLASAAQLLYLAGRYLLEGRGDAEAARPVLERAAAVRERAHGSDDPRVAFDLGYLNGALLPLGAWSAMARNAARAAEILEGEYGARDRTVITHVNNAALLMARAGERDRARAWYSRALGLAEPVFGRAHPFCATILSNLGDLSAGEGDLPAARDAYRRALAIDEAAYGPRHESVARDLARLGRVLAETGEHAAARIYLERALSWFTAAHGPDDARTEAVRDVLSRLDGRG
jgi:tetratricopeptide (TPR) repeat protein